MTKAIDLVGQKKAERAATAFNGFAARMVGDATVGSFEELRAVAAKPVAADQIVVFETNAYRIDPAPEAARFRVCVGASAPLNCWGDGGDHETPAAAVEAFTAWCERTMRDREPSPVDMSDSMLQR